MTEDEINETIAPLLYALEALQTARSKAYQQARRLVEKMPKEHQWRATTVAAALEDLKTTIEDDMFGVIKP